MITSDTKLVDAYYDGRIIGQLAYQVISDAGEVSSVTYRTRARAEDRIAGLNSVPHVSQYSVRPVLILPE